MIDVLHVCHNDSHCVCVCACVCVVILYIIYNQLFTWLKHDWNVTILTWLE